MYLPVQRDARQEGRLFKRDSFDFDFKIRSLVTIHVQTCGAPQLVLLQSKHVKNNDEIGEWTLFSKTREHEALVSKVRNFPLTAAMIKNISPNSSCSLLCLIPDKKVI